MNPPHPFLVWFSHHVWVAWACFGIVLVGSFVVALFVGDIADVWYAVGAPLLGIYLFQVCAAFNVKKIAALLPTQRHPANPEQAAGDEAANRSISKLRPSEDGLRLLIFSGLVARFTRSIRPRPSARSHYCPMLLEAPMTGIANCSGS